MKEIERKQEKRKREGSCNIIIKGMKEKVSNGGVLRNIGVKVQVRN